MFFNTLSIKVLKNTESVFRIQVQWVGGVNEFFECNFKTNNGPFVRYMKIRGNQIDDTFANLSECVKFEVATTYLLVVEIWNIF